MGIGIMTSVTGFVAFCANDLPIQDQDPNKIVIYSDIEKAPQKISKVVFMISGQKENSGNITMEMQGETIVVNKNVLGNVEKNTLSSKAVHSTIAGGSGNKIENGAEEIKGSAIVGGMNNQVTKSYSVIVGGENNQVNKEDSIILGGKNNTVSKSKTIVLGNNNKANGNGQESTVILGNNITENTNAGDNVLMGKAYTFQGKESFVWNTKTGKNIVGDKMFIINNDHGLAVGVDKTNGADVTVKGNFQIQEEPVKNAIITASGSIKTEKSCSCFYNGREWVARNGDLCGVVCNKTQGECGSELFKCAKGVLSQTVQTVEGNYRNCAGVENDIIVSKQCVICNTGYTNSNGKCVSINKKNVNCNPVSSPKIQNTTVINQTWDTITQTYVPSLTGTYSATAIAGTCTFRCATGTVYDSAKDQCITYGCVGTIPANAGRNNNIIPNNNSTNYFYSLNTNEACSYSCNAGTYKLVNTCTKCPGSMTSVKASETISSCFATCNPGTYLKAKDSSCTQCPAGYSCPGGTFYYNENIDQGKNICGKDTYAQVGSAKCTNCPTKYHSAEGSVSISKCYLNVEEKKCKTNANGSETSEVQKGKYNESHISYYGSADNCNKNCTAIANATFTSNGSHATGCDFQCNNGYVKIGNACKKTCTINGTTLYEGDSIVMYETATPAGECKSQVRTCTNGVLSGTYTNATCYNGCKKPWKKSEYIAHGTSLTGYKDNFQSCENPQATCSYQIRTCNNGVLSGSFSNESCSLESYSCSAGTYPITGACPAHGICESCTPYLAQGNLCNKGTQRSRLIGCEGGYHEYNDTCVENPSCGSSNGSSTHNAPTSNFCTKGTNTTVITGPNSFKWTCKNGGEEVSCSAIRTYNSCPKSGSCNATEHNGVCIGYTSNNVSSCEDVKVISTCNDGSWMGTVPTTKECKEISQAILTTGMNFNVIIKRLAGTTILDDDETIDKNIQSIQRAPSIPSGVTTELISIEDSIPIYAWYDQGTIYYYSESETIFMNKDASDMFDGLSSVKNIDLSGIDTSKVTNMVGMFSHCRSLTSLNVTNFDTSKVTKMNYMFGGCSSLTSLDLSNFNTSNVTNMSSMFAGCSSLTSLDLSNFNTSNVTNMSFMFAGCSSLTSLDLSNFNTSNVTDMDSMFRDCRSLTSLNVTNFDTSKVTNMMEMFEKCSSLTSLDLSSFDTSSVMNMLLMFSDCSSLTSLDLSSFDTSKVRNMQSMFSNCSSLTSIDLSSFDTSNVTKMVGMFDDCRSLTSLNVTNFDTSKVEGRMYRMFAGCSSLTSLDLSSFDTSNVDDMMQMFAGCSSLIELDLSNFDTSNVGIMETMFEGCSSLTSLDLSSFDTRNVRDMHAMFYDCSNLKTIYASENFTTNSVTAGNRMFDRSPKLEGGCNPTPYSAAKVDYTMAKIDKPGQEGYFTDKNMQCEKEFTEAILNTGKNFNVIIKKLAGASNPTYKTTDTNIQAIQRASSIPSGVTTELISIKDSIPIYAWYDQGTIYYYSESETIFMNQDASYMFYNLASVKNIDLSGIDTSKVTDMSYMFNQCSSLTSLDLSIFNTSNVNNMESMFFNCTHLTSLNVSSFNTSNVTNMASMFYGCSKLTSLDLSNFDTRNVKNMSYMFSDNSNLVTIYASEKFTTNVVETGSDMFYDSPKLEGGCNPTRYSAAKVDYTMAKIDKPGQEGYLTDKNMQCEKEFTEAILITGKNFNVIIKKLAGASNPNYATFDSNIQSIQRASSIPSGVTTELISIKDSIPIYAWYDKGTIYYYSESETIFMNKDASDMFAALYSVKNIDLSGIDTSKVTNMVGMFDSCSSLTELDVTNFDTSKVTNMNAMFSNCYKLTSLDLSHFDTSNVTNMGGMFENCSSLTELDVTNFDTSKVTNMSYMFSHCSSLASLDLSHFDTSKVTNMNSMFSSCSSLTSLDLSNFNTSNVTNMSYMFRYCESLTSLNVKNFNTSKVTNMSDMFSNCYKLTSLDLSHFDTSNVTNMGGMFENCNSLTSLNVSHFDTSNVTNMGGMFQACISLTSLNVTNFDTSKVTNMTSMFSSCSLTSLDLSSFDTSNVNAMKLMFNSCRKLKTIYTSESFTTNSVTTGYNMFGDTLKLVGGNGTTWTGSKVDYTMAKIDKPGQKGYFTAGASPAGKTATLLQGSDFNKAIKILAGNSNPTTETYNRSIQRIKKADSLPEGVTTTTISTADSETQVLAWFDGGAIYYYTEADQIFMNQDASGMFANCNSLTSLDVSNFDTSNVTNMSSMFDSCYKLTSLDLSHFDTSNVTDMNHMFYACNSLTSLDVSNFDTSNVTNMSHMFGGCSSLTSLDVTKFDTSNVTNMRSMFYGCRLTSLDVTNFDTAKVTNMRAMFDNCRSLTSLNVTNFDTSKVTDMRYMFVNCNSLTSLDLSNFDTSNVTNMNLMFGGCSSLTSLDLSNFDTSNVEHMGSMFDGCSSLTELDVTNFDTSNVRDMSSMFASASNLKTIYASKDFTTDAVTKSTNMFFSATSLVGGNRTTYNSGNTDKSMAKIDKPGQVGYFTKGITCNAGYYKTGVNSCEQCGAKYYSDAGATSCSPICGTNKNCNWGYSYKTGNAQSWLCAKAGKSDVSCP